MHSLQCTKTAISTQAAPHKGSLLNLSSSSQNTTAWTLKDEIDHFLDPEQSTQQVCLLLGEPFSGKSTFCIDLQQELWDSFVPHAAAPVVPLFVDMNRFTCDTAKLAVDAHLKSLKLTEEECQLLRHSHYNFVCIFDGYNEMYGGGFVNLWDSNSLGQLGAAAKAIITCRPSYLPKDQHSTSYLFCPDAKRTEDRESRLLRLWLVTPPFQAVAAASASAAAAASAAYNAAAAAAAGTAASPSVHGQKSPQLFQRKGTVSESSRGAFARRTTR